MKTSSGMFINAATIFLSLSFFMLTKDGVTLLGLPFAGAAIIGYGLSEAKKGN